MKARHPLRAALCCLLAIALAEGPTWAIPPLVSGDIPTADHGTYELFLGYVLTRVLELTIEAPIVLLRD